MLRAVGELVVAFDVWVASVKLMQPQFVWYGGKVGIIGRWFWKGPKYVKMTPIFENDSYIPKVTLFVESESYRSHDATIKPIEGMTPLPHEQSMNKPLTYRNGLRMSKKVEASGSDAIKNFGATQNESRYMFTVILALIYSVILRLK